jgi:hypothetical protein
LPDDVRLEQGIDPPVWFFLSMYDAVGRDYEWRDRFRQAEEDPDALAAFVGPAWSRSGSPMPRLAAGVLHARLARAGPATWPISALCPRRWEAVSAGALLRIAVARVGPPGVTRMTVNTCTLDHPRALDLYQKIGFRPVDTGTHPRLRRRPRPVPTSGLIRGSADVRDPQPPEPDKILRLMGMFAADPRPDKVDLGVGVYRSPEGVTPIMAAVKEAERRIWETQETKGYVGIPAIPPISRRCAA